MQSECSDADNCVSMEKVTQKCKLTAKCLTLICEGTQTDIIVESQSSQTKDNRNQQNYQFRKPGKQKTERFQQNKLTDTKTLKIETSQQQQSSELENNEEDKATKIILTKVPENSDELVFYAQEEKTKTDCCVYCM